MSERKVTRIACIICLATILIGIVLYSFLPNNVPAHYSDSFIADTFLNKLFAITILPIGFTFINLLVYFKAISVYKMNGFINWNIYYFFHIFLTIICVISQISLVIMALS